VQLDRNRILAAYDDGVAGVQASAAAVRDWGAPTLCAAWDVTELAGHLLTIAHYYQRIIDAAVLARPLVDFPRGRRLREMNAVDLAALTAGSGRSGSPGSPAMRSPTGTGELAPTGTLCSDYGRRSAR